MRVQFSSLHLQETFALEVGAKAAGLLLLTRLHRQGSRQSAGSYCRRLAGLRSTSGRKGV